MSTTSRSLALAVISASLAGCGAAPHKAMDAATVTKVTASQAVVGVKQSEIYAVIQPSANPLMGAGAIGAAIGSLEESAIDNSNYKANQKNVGPLRDALLSFDFDSLALADFQAQLPKAAWLHLGQVTLTKDTSGEGYDKPMNASQVPYTLFVSLDYHLSIDYRQLLVTEHLWLSPKPVPGSTLRHGANGYTYTVPGSDPGNAVYANTVTYETAIPDGVIPHQLAHQEAVDDAVQYWAKDNAAVTRSTLTTALSELSRLGLQCLQDYDKPVEAKDEVAVGSKEGHIIEKEDGDREVIQFDDGTLMSIDTQLVKILRTGKQY